MKTLLALLLLSNVALADKLYKEGSGDSWDCAKDASIKILANDGTYTFKGACKAIAVAGNHNTITVDSIAKLSVTGNENKVEAGTAENVSTMGNENQVAVRKGTPKVSNLGNHNKVTTGGAAPAAPAQSKPAPPAPVGDATAIDCAKQPTYEIANGDGAYAFTGTCTRILVAGGENRVSIENVKELVVAGAENTIDVGGADKIAVSGNDNKLRYKKGLTGAKPKVTNVGQHSTVEQIK